MTLHVDRHEADDLIALLAQVVPVEKSNLNDASRSDFYWIAQGESYQFEHKQAGEIMGSLDSCEEQLRRAYPLADHCGLVIEGIITPSPDGCTVYAWKDYRGGVAAFESRTVHQSYTGYRSWLAGLRAWGISVLEVPNRTALVSALVAEYTHSLKPAEEHATFRRYIPEKHRIDPWNPYVLLLMACGGIGEQLAEALVGYRVDIETGEITFEGRFRTPYDCFRADPGVIARAPLRSGKRVVGPAAARKLLESIGRAE